MADRLNRGDHHPAAALAFCLPAKSVDKAALLSVRSSHAAERPGPHCGIVLPREADAGSLLSSFITGRFDLSAVVCSSMLNHLGGARYCFLWRLVWSGSKH